jgi:hypothetical protein
MTRSPSNRLILPNSHNSTMQPILMISRDLSLSNRARISMSHKNGASHQQATRAPVSHIYELLCNTRIDQRPWKPLNTVLTVNGCGGLQGPSGPVRHTERGAYIPVLISLGTPHLPQSLQCRSITRLTAVSRPMSRRTTHDNASSELSSRWFQMS